MLSAKPVTSVEKGVEVEGHVASCKLSFVKLDRNATLPPRIADQLPAIRTPPEPLTFWFRRAGMAFIRILPEPETRTLASSRGVTSTLPLPETWILAR